MHDIPAHHAEIIRDAAARGAPLRIHGGGSKDFYGGAPAGELLDATDYRGIIDYEPSELVLTARAGTPLTEIELALRERGQMLAFEPPHFGPGATLGGCIASGLSGPRRAYAGAVRDFVLGVRMLDGMGNDLRFGGRVMKNVAGFDVSRLMAGSMGTLGLLLEVSLKVLPLPPAEATLVFDLTESKAIKRMNEWSGQPLPVGATAWSADTLHVRLAGADAAVTAAMRLLGGQRVEPAPATAYWNDIREQTDSWFQSTLPLWRLSVKSTTPPLDMGAETLIEWGGALRWLKGDLDPQRMRDAARLAGGHATLFRRGDKSAGVFHPLAPAMRRIQQNLKRAWDPAGILNRGRLYEF